MTVGCGVCVSVGRGVCVTVGCGVCVSVGAGAVTVGGMVALGISVADGAEVADGSGVTVGAGVADGAAVADGAGVTVGAAVADGAGVSVGKGVWVCVGLDVAVNVGVGVWVGGGVGVGVGGNSIVKGSLNVLLSPPALRTVTWTSCSPSPNSSAGIVKVSALMICGGPSSKATSICVISVWPPARTSTSRAPCNIASTASPPSATVGGSAATSNSRVCTISAPAASTARRAMVFLPGGKSAGSKVNSIRLSCTTTATPGSVLMDMMGDCPVAKTLPKTESLMTVSSARPSTSRRGAMTSTSKTRSTVVVCPPALLARTLSRCSPGRNSKGSRFSS